MDKTTQTHTKDKEALEAEVAMLKETCLTMCQQLEDATHHVIEDPTKFYRGITAVEELRSENEKLHEEIDELNVALEHGLQERVVIEDIAHEFGKTGNDFDWCEAIGDLQEDNKELKHEIKELKELGTEYDPSVDKLVDKEWLEGLKKEITMRKCEGEALGLGSVNIHEEDWLDNMESCLAEDGNGVTIKDYKEWVNYESDEEEEEEDEEE